MMREIKFRAYNRNKGKFEFFHLCSHAPMTSVKIPAEGSWDALDDWEQFTGLTDVNGVEIYEGDVVKLNWIRSYTGTIAFKNGSFALHLPNVDAHLSSHFCEIYASKSEVIGNIHQNPELLK